MKRGLTLTRIMIDDVVIAGINCAMHGCRLSHGSVDKVDSSFYRFGPKDIKLATALYKLGTDHSAFLRQIQVWFRLKAPMYFWKHWDKYKWVNRLNNEVEERSASTMHSILKDELTSQDFAWGCPPDILEFLNGLREDKEFELLVNSLPQGYMQERQINTNLAVLLTMVEQRRNHKLREWSDFINAVYPMLYIKDFIEG